MKKLSADLDLDAFFHNVRTTSKRLLLTDYDGTLSPFTTELKQAYPYPDIISVLTDIIQETDTYTAVISGRSIKDLVKFLGPLHQQMDLWGSHGCEHLSRDGVYTLQDLPEGVEEALETAEKLVISLGLEEQIERKPISTAVHWRGYSPGRAKEIQKQVREAWKAFADHPDLELLPFEAGLELRSAVCDKGTAVQVILEHEIPPNSDFVLTYLGDEETDEDAFEVIGDRGLSVLVREDFRPTLASLWLQPPEELETFLKRWKTACLDDASSPGDFS